MTETRISRTIARSPLHLSHATLALPWYVRVQVAIFGLGDSSGYADNFCDAMDELKTCFEGQGATVIGSVSTDSYEYEDSKSVADGKFVGLACDEDNQPELSEERVTAWIAQIKSEGMPL